MQPWQMPQQQWQQPQHWQHLQPQQHMNGDAMQQPAAVHGGEGWPAKPPEAVLGPGAEPLAAELRKRGLFNWQPLVSSSVVCPDLSLRSSAGSLDFCVIVPEDLRSGAPEQALLARLGSEAMRRSNTSYALALLGAPELLRLQNVLQNCAAGGAATGAPTLVPCRDISQAANFVHEVSLKRERQFACGDREDVWNQFSQAYCGSGTFLEDLLEAVPGVRPADLEQALLAAGSLRALASAYGGSYEALPQALKLPSLAVLFSEAPQSAARA